MLQLLLRQAADVKQRLACLLAAPTQPKTKDRDSFITAYRCRDTKHTLSNRLCVCDNSQVKS